MVLKARYHYFPGDKATQVTHLDYSIHFIPSGLQVCLEENTLRCWRFLPRSEVMKGIQTHIFYFST